MTRPEPHVSPTMAPAAEHAPRSLQVVLTTGPRDAARATLGLEAALAGCVSGIDVSVFLTLDATEWACEPRRTGCGQRVYELIDQLDALGARITVCSACAADHCTNQRRGAGVTAGASTSTAVATATPTTAGIELVGLTTLVERIASGVPTVTF